MVVETIANNWLWLLKKIAINILMTKIFFLEPTYIYVTKTAKKGCRRHLNIIQHRLYNSVWRFEIGVCKIALYPDM